MDFSTTPEVLALIPLTVGLVEAVKAIGLPDRFAPLLSLIIGVVLAALVVNGIPFIILGGITIGLMASGLYSGVRALAINR